MTDHASSTQNPRMTEPPLDLLEPLASIGQQRRFVIGGTAQKYLVPDEILNDAWHFCERAEMPLTHAKLTEPQREAVAVLREAIERLGRCTMLYDRTNLSELIEGDKCWAVMRDRAGQTLAAFGQSALD
ncbi:hypothetical protein [Novosphingobium sp.]|uniref:hypothetical protein n=2 Tax=Novosphingobium TaxID=165696 RepID=UPI00262BDC93|nr:hypothetical protein [Novosphingobium sp.]